MASPFRFAKQSIEKDAKKAEVKNLEDINLELFEESKLGSLSTLADKLSFNQDNLNTQSVLDNFYNGSNSEIGNTVNLDDTANSNIIGVNDINRDFTENDRIIHKTHRENNDNSQLTNGNDFVDHYCDQGMDGHNANCNLQD